MTVIDRANADTSAITITPKSPTISAEIGGVDLTTELSDDAIVAIRRALLDYKVLFFRDQDIWDNRACQHYAVSDYWPHVRRVERVTIVGDTPYYDAAQAPIDVSPSPFRGQLRAWSDS